MESTGKGIGLLSARLPEAAAHVRQAARKGRWTTHTSGLAPDHVQGNVVMLPETHASEFLRYCIKNPASCPLLSVSEPGDVCPPGLGATIDIRTDLPRYRVFRDGEVVAEPTDVSEFFRSDLVTFVLGCSFSFERALLDAGIHLRHVERGHNVAMFRTNVPTMRAGTFEGPLVVSMRPMRAQAAIQAIRITAHFGRAHGAPMHIGDPSLIGVHDLTKPDFGDPIEVLDGELPVFWPCGVTPQLAIEAAKPDLCITHFPGAMLVTDALNRSLMDW